MSWQMRAAALYLRITRKRRHASTASAERILAEPKGPSALPRRLTRPFNVTTKTIDGFDVHIVSPDGVSPDGVSPDGVSPDGVSPDGVNPFGSISATVVYLHGGAYVGGVHRLHWSLIADVASGSGVDVWAPIYGLAPQYQADDAIRLMHKVFQEASSAGRGYLIGDSAGGGLALAATLAWQRSGGTPPVGLTLIAPWLDIGLRNPGIAAVEPRDPWLSPVGLRVLGRAWAAGMSADDPRVSPLFGDLTAVPPIHLYVGDRDITLPDCRALRDTAPPGRVGYHEEPGAVHVYPLLPVPEGRAARKDLVAHVRSALVKV
jgi:epsilon-lactone hydrolase